MVNDVTVRVVLTQMTIEKWDAKIVDIDNAFLHGDLEHEIYDHARRVCLMCGAS